MEVLECLGLVVLEVFKELWEGLCGPGLVRDDVEGDLYAAVDKVRDLDKVLLDEAAGGERGGADAEAAGDEGLEVAGDAVLVEGDPRVVQDALDARAVDALGAEVEEDEVVLRAARHEVVPPLQQLRRERRAVGLDLRRVLPEHRRVHLPQRSGDPRDRVVVRPALQPREHGLVDLLLEGIHDFYFK